MNRHYLLMLSLFLFSYSLNCFATIDSTTSAPSTTAPCNTSYSAPLSVSTANAAILDSWTTTPAVTTFTDSSTTYLNPNMCPGTYVIEMIFTLSPISSTSCGGGMCCYPNTTMTTHSGMYTIFNGAPLCITGGCQNGNPSGCFNSQATFYASGIWGPSNGGLLNPPSLTSGGSDDVSFISGYVSIHQ